VTACYIIPQRRICMAPY